MANILGYIVLVVMAITHILGLWKWCWEIAK